ncbi:Na+/H+ antiporter NhaC [Lactiplantibacillus pentosus]|uniref:Na(+)/H(+) antiporter n=1 Tax=Lactiplantibacillus pentosus IG1 TaxID=1042160 RepID=G0M555_LACPE|nr:Na+/H+ antiporter NhaC [Lactiplantibacillus pentosus]CCC17366.1 Na(+)/H(+) antiporter [Lactiplantibacillus pentosus IG1]MCT3284337.1 Na+/H+ antiporter NhaC [Lactiplantibacillus pentosus]MCT3303618.1 Na+/H+ antiporter NhaC [Lactiplantibacillus pentosus]PRO80777.1 Na+/H+ antiporter NhaC [Lactiplantibacillus pentosus]PRO81188.1 Na+/H+ antiporter NhaC [Lactiplantibacillus pentosus]
MNKTTEPQISTLEAVIVLLVVLGIMSAGVIGWGLSPQVPVLLAMGVVTAWAMLRGFPWSAVNAGIKEGIDKGIVPIFIFILIGAMISTWIAAGTIPTLMVIGFKIINIQWFLPSVFIVCTLVGAAVGSAFTVTSTVGIAFFGMGVTMNLNPALVAGAIISGGIFGDKLSPLSETNNLASAVVDTDLFTHIKHLLWSTLPAGLISLGLFAMLGHSNTGTSLAKINQTVAVLNGHFSISALALLPIVLVFVCAGFKMPAIPTMLLNIFVSAGLILFEQPGTSMKKLTAIINTGFVSKTGNTSVDTLLSRGGIVSMMSMVALIVVTLSLGGLLVKFGLINQIMTPVAKHLNSDGKLVLAGVLTCIGVNVFVGEQFLSIILPGRAFRKAFNDGGLSGNALGRVLEDGGTVINYLVPWGVGGVFLTTTLGVPTVQYLPFVFFSLLCPIISVISGFTGIGMAHLKHRSAVKAEQATTAQA